MLVRHGESEYTKLDLIAGDKGCPGLTPHGRDQAIALRRRLVRDGVRTDVVLSSTVRRARETADVLSPAVLPAGGQIRLDPSLCEPDPGEGDGLTRAEFTARYGSPGSHADPDRPWAPGGESWNDFVRRVRRTIDEIPALPSFWRLIAFNDTAHLSTGVWSGISS